jgi:formylglycine-generating enzyme required for sulfatase activity
MTGKEYRLLTEPEWEYAARAGSDQPFSLALDLGKRGSILTPKARPKSSGKNS